MANDKWKMLRLLIQPGMNADDVRDPKHLPVDLDTAQSMLRQVFLFQTEKRKVRQIAQDRLEPAVLRHDLAHARVLKLVHVEREHCYVLRRAGCGDRIKN